MASVVPVCDSFGGTDGISELTGSGKDSRCCTDLELNCLFSETELKGSYIVWLDLSRTLASSGGDSAWLFVILVDCGSLYPNERCSVEEGNSFRALHCKLRPKGDAFVICEEPGAENSTGRTQVVTIVAGALGCEVRLFAGLSNCSL